MDVPVGLIEAIIACAVAFIGASLQGTIGFGLGLISVPLLVLIDPVFVPGPILLAALVLNLLMFTREKHSIDPMGFKWAIFGRAIGAVLGASLLSVFPQKSLSLLFGSMVLLAVLLNITGLEFRVTPKNLFGAGSLSGFMSTTSSIGGVPMALIYQKHPGARLRATLSIVFIFGTLLSIGSLVVIKHFGLREIVAASVLIPGILLSFTVSNRTSKIVDKGYVRPAVLIASSISSVAVLLRALL